MTDTKRNEPHGYAGGRGGATAEAVAELRECGEHIGQAGAIAAEAATERFRDMKEMTSAKLEHGWEKVKCWEQSFEGQISEHPLRSVLVATGVGVVLGLLWRRK